MKAGTLADIDQIICHNRIILSGDSGQSNETPNDSAHVFLQRCVFSALDFYSVSTGQVQNSLGEWIFILLLSLSEALRCEMNLRRIGFSATPKSTPNESHCRLIGLRTAREGSLNTTVDV